ncbi:hypothetical protein BH09ACT11_BH09ACT11_06640 [soil metagenome]
MAETRETCAHTLDELASDERFAGRRDDLHSLAAALRDQGNGSWTGVDLVAAFPPEATISVARHQLLERILGMVAGASVFLPVGWTWWSLRSATTAYNQFLGAHTPQEIVGQTYLALWSTGFEGRLDGLHRLGPMATVSLLLIMLAVGSIVLHRLVAERNVANEDKDAYEARKALVVAMVGAQRHLNERRTDDPRFLEEAIKRSVLQLQTAQTASRKGVQELSAATTKAVDELGRATSSSVAEVNAVAAGLLSKLQPLLDATSEAGGALSQAAAAAAAAQTQMSASTTEIQAVLSEAIVEFKASVNESNTQLTSQTAHALSGLAGGVARVAAAKDEWTAALREGLESNTRAVDDLGAGVEDMVRLLQTHESTLQAQANDLVRAADLSQQLLGELRVRAESNGFGQD